MTAPSKRSMQKSAKGFSAVVCYMPKHEVNVGTLWRSAFLYKSSMIATVGRRYVHQASDTSKTPLRIPMMHFSDIDDLITHLPHGCPLVGVELAERAEPLERFCHPHSAAYMVGGEDFGIPPRILDKCHKIVKISTPQPWSLNVAVAGSLVLADRYIKSLR